MVIHLKSLRRSHVLRSYVMGSFHSRTIFPEPMETYALGAKYLHVAVGDRKTALRSMTWTRPSGLFPALTFVHETVHCLQDLITGFGDFAGSFTREYSSIFVRFFRKLPVPIVRIPFSRWCQVENDRVRPRLCESYSSLSCLSFSIPELVIW